jgi:aspartokinase/homoserine dehydrogenase 1
LAAAGTQVLDLEAEQKFSKGAVTIKGFATIDNVCLINIEGTGMVGVPGA